jgi:uncharacterized YccA/Bax inhibitor family protein
MMRTSNPTLNDNVFRSNERAIIAGDSMTVQGTVNKSGLLLLLVLLTAAYTWRMYFTAADSMGIWVLGGAVGGFIIALVTVFKKQWAAVTAPLYALLEGLVLGGISSLLEARYPGIVIQAVGLTFGTLFGLLFAYRSGLIKATENFKLGVAAATGAIFVVYLAQFVLGIVGVQVGFLHEAIFGAGWLGIGVSVVVIIVAALNLVLDFDFIEHGAAARAPKYMEWYGAFGLLVTLIWLYLEILRLLSKLRSR